MCVFTFSTKLSETFYILRIIQPDVITNLKKLEFVQKNNSNIKFHENPSGGSRLVTHGRTDSQI